MFSGIVEDIGVVSEVLRDGGKHRIHVEAPLLGGRLDNVMPRVGDSIAVSGVCLTISELSGGGAWFDIASETGRCTTLSFLQADSKVNLEPSLRVGDQLHGHFVSGHVDAVAQLVDLSDEMNTRRLEFELPVELRSFITSKGSITLDGVSLTVGEVNEESFSVYIVPHTWEVTTFRDLEVGKAVNLEVDMLARYVERMLSDKNVAST